jgi:hypothetical protein
MKSGNTQTTELRSGEEKDKSPVVNRPTGPEANSQSPLGGETLIRHFGRKVRIINFIMPDPLIGVKSFGDGIPFVFNAFD